MKAKKILVADDSLTIQKVIRLALSNEGYEIQAISDGNDAVQQISLFQPDVVLIDVSLPGQNAFEVKRTVNSHDDLKNVQFVLMSSAFEKVDETQAEEVKFQGRLTKPFDPAHLREVLHHVLALASHRKMEPASLLTRPGLTPQPSFAPPELSEISTGFELEPPSSLPDENEFAPSEPSIQLERSALPPLPPMAPTHEEPLPDADIRQLTESTIRMSGLDDFNWNIQEPSLKPPPAFQDTGNSTFDLSDPNDPLSSANAYHSAPLEMPNQPTFPPPLPSGPAIPGQSSAPRFALEATPITSPKFTPEPTPIAVSKFTPEPTPVSVSTLTPEPTLPQRPSAIQAPPVVQAAPTITDEQIEELVRKKVEEALEKMAKSIIPQVAERIIKAEIHRMLSEQP